MSLFDIEETQNFNKVEKDKNKFDEKNIINKEVQDNILKAGKAATLHSAQFLRDSEAAIKKDLIAKGMQIDDPADGEKEFIDLATKAVWPNFYESIGGKDKLDNILAVLGR